MISHCKEKEKMLKLIFLSNEAIALARSIKELELAIMIESISKDFRSERKAVIVAEHKEIIIQKSNVQYKKNNDRFLVLKDSFIKRLLFLFTGE